MGYTLNANIQIGDIILIKSNTKFGDVISSVTKGPFSHVGLVFNERKYIEALTTGVQATSTGQVLVKDTNKIKILRPILFQNGGLTEDYIKRIVEESNPHRYRKYNFSGAATSIFEKDIKHNDKKYFCSELVASIYKNIGITLFDKDAAHVTPNDYLQLIGSSLEDVTSYVLSEIPKLSILYQTEIEYIDTGKETAFKESELLSKFFIKVEQILKKKDMGLNKIGFFELLEIYELEDEKMMIFLDNAFANEYKKLKINSYIKEFYSNIKDKNLEIFEEDLKNFNSDDIMIYLKNQERNKQHNLNKSNEFKAYIMFINKIKNHSHHKYANELLNYFEIYLGNTDKLAKEFDREEEIIHKQLKILQEYLFSSVDSKDVYNTIKSI